MAGIYNKTRNTNNLHTPNLREIYKHTDRKLELTLHKIGLLNFNKNVLLQKRVFKRVHMSINQSKLSHCTYIYHFAVNRKFVENQNLFSEQ